eukprot:m.148008 g.148008  ORF g.148008 m.148008 type:complete len:383 (-) comp16124_c3_seq6:147-1295(-)
MDVAKEKSRRKVKRAKRKCRTDLRITEWNKHRYADRQDLLHPTLSSQLPIIDYDTVSVKEFREKFEAKSQPAIIRGCVSKWPACRRWKLSRLEKKYGDEKFKCGEDDDGYAVKMKLKHYLPYLHDNDDDSPLYVFDSGFAEHPVKSDLTKDYEVPKYFKDDLFDYAPNGKRPPHRWFVIGPQRSGTDMHIDPLGTAAWNALVHGYKRWVIFPPNVPKSHVRSRSKECESEGISWFDVVYPRILREGKAAPIEFIQEPGDIVYMPGGWHHVVLNITDTVAVTQNFCSPTTFPTVWRRTVKGRPKLSQAWRKRLETRRPEVGQLIATIDLDEDDGLPSSSSSDSSSSSSSCLSSDEESDASSSDDRKVRRKKKAKKGKPSTSTR